MIFQRQGCVLSNDYEELSIPEATPPHILLFILVSLSAKRETPHVTVVSPSAKRETPGHVTVGTYGAWVPSGVIGPRVVRWYKAAGFVRAGS
jgi:hypothetical protein